MSPSLQTFVDIFLKVLGKHKGVIELLENAILAP